MTSTQTPQTPEIVLPPADFEVRLFFHPGPHRLSYEGVSLSPRAGVRMDLRGDLTVAFGVGTTNVRFPRRVRFVPAEPPELEMEGLEIWPQDDPNDVQRALEDGPVPCTPFSVTVQPGVLLLEDQDEQGALGTWHYRLLLRFRGCRLGVDPEIKNLGTSEPVEPDSGGG